MQNGIECVMKSVDEPQLEKGRPAMYNQTIPFANVIHINGVCPESKAINQALDRLEYTWSLWLDGDAILYEDTHEKIRALEKRLRAKGYTEALFSLFDPFLGKNICCCILKKSDFLQQFRSDNVLANDASLTKKMKKVGRKSARFINKIIVGTHFENPTDLQVFARFYSRGVKVARGHPNSQFRDLFSIFEHKYASTGNKQYMIAKEALTLGTKLGHYPTSHNIEFDREMYEKWKSGQLQ